MPSAWPGGCQCGAVRYEVAAAEVLTLICCHCRECQKQSASAFGMSLILPRAAFALLQGELLSFQWRSDRRAARRGSFCPACGVRIYNDDAEAGPWVSVKAGTLDDTSLLAPVGQLWTIRAQSWLALPDGLLCYEGEPESDAALEAAYRERRRP